MKLMLCKARTHRASTDYCRRSTVRRLQRGVTIIELLMALTIGALLMGVGIPAYESLVRNNRLATDTNELVASIHYARSEAIKRGVPVRICISNNANIGVTGCDGTATDWSAGWNIRILGAGGAVLRRHAPLDGSTTLIEEGPNTRTGRMDFDRLGFTADGRTIVACEATNTTGLARGLIVSPIGQVRKAQDAGGDGIVENAAGTNVTCPTS